MSNGRMFLISQTNAGFGMLLIMLRILFLPTFSGNEKMRFLKNLKHFLNRSVLRGFTLMTVGRMNDILMKIHTLLERKTLKR